MTSVWKWKGNGISESDKLSDCFLCQSAGLGEVGGGGTQERKVIHPAPTGIGPSQALFSPGLGC